MSRKTTKKKNLVHKGLKYVSFSQQIQTNIFLNPQQFKILGLVLILKLLETIIIFNPKFLAVHFPNSFSHFLR